MAKGTLNKVMLIGRLGKDIDFKTTAGGFSIANLTLATNEVSGSKEKGTLKESTEWHKITLFGKLAEIANQYASKGSRIYIEGKLQTTKWQDKNGIDRYTTQIVGDSLQLLDSKKTNDSNQPVSTQNTNSSSDFFNDDIPF